MMACLVQYHPRRSMTVVCFYALNISCLYSGSDVEGEYCPWYRYRERCRIAMLISIRDGEDMVIFIPVLDIDGA